MSGHRIFQLEKRGNIGVVVFNLVDEAMNTWTEKAIMSFREVVEELERDETLTGVVFISGKPNNFFAGANLKLIEGITTRDDAMEALNIFHDSFNRTSVLKIPTVAAINGACVGGGLEFALACTARIATDAKSTMIGLPECNVGLFPGGGGSQRLPRLIGYPAVELILRGTLLPGAKAFETGVVDRLVSADADLLKEALTLLEAIITGKAQLKRQEHDFSQVDAVMSMARQEVLKATKGRELPGHMLAIKAMQEGLKVSLEEGLEIEKNYFADVALAPQAKGSINTFFLKTLTDKPKALMTKGFEPKPLTKAAVLGFGTMGRGITIDILRNTAIPVIVKDIPEALEPGKAFVRKILDGMAAKKRLKVPVDDIMDRLILVSEYTDDFRDVAIVVEAVFEDIAVKKQVYGELCGVVSDDCIIASNTSSISIDSMAPFVTHPERFAGLHFFSPVWMMQLVEVVRGTQTHQDAIDNLLNFTAAIRKRPLVCRDNPGFVVNAMLFPYLLNALQYIEEGTSIEKLDGAVTSFGMPLGPIRLTDEVGIDIPHKVFVGMGVKQETLSNVVGDGRLGLKKSGKGFFLADGTVDPSVLPLIAKRKEKERTVDEIQEGLLEALVRVARDLLDRQVVDDPRMIDVGMIWATGFPPDRGGPLKWADLTGMSEKLFGTTFYGQ
ncbi:MAG: enoyl-CoA hydratase/isomerase family protein [Deltaproteobacteria bacterium]|nr:enoyl-CoA hydratase/isomerase family protein [Deltaproteobacteria bacterium]MBN2687180.1 enoyl-CoA hydratase/isomerase family protein [Deltaproteobacteria bacterium]